LKKLSSYSASGKYSPISFIVLAAILLFIAPILSFLYAKFIYYNPFVIINIGLLIGAAYLLSKTIRGLIWYGKIRHQGLAFWLSMLITFWFHFLHWTVWTHEVVINWARESQFFSFTPPTSIFPIPFELASNLGQLWELMMEINDQGSWGVDEWAVSGFFLWIFWLIELIVFLFVGFTSWAVDIDKPFSEETNDWLKASHSPRLQIIDCTAFEKSMLANDVSFLDTFSRSVKEREDYNSITLFTAERGQNFLSLDKYSVNNGEEGSVDYDSQNQMNQVAISKEFVAKLKEVFASLKAGPIEENITVSESGNTQTISPEPAQDSQATNPITVDEEEEEEEAEIISPVIHIKVNENTSSVRVLYGLIMLFAGGGLVYMSTVWAGDTHTEGLIFGVLLLIGGFASIIKVVSNSGAKHAFAMKINPSYITLGSSIVNSEKLIIIPSRLLREVTSYVSEGGKRSLTIIAHKNIIQNQDNITLDIAMAKADWLEVKDVLNKMAGKKIEERKDVVEDFLKKRPSLLG